MSKILPQAYHLAKEQIAEVVSRLHNMAIDIDHKEMIDALGEVRDRLNDPFMFVVVGEVKSGKSSFINALLESKEEICKVAPSPMTDTIQQILYGEEDEELIINQYLKKIYRPIDILKEIAIVDTPGTNTIIDHHQEITERFLPASDLIVFVFEAKNPYRQSAWDFFDLVNEEWHKKVIFVLQQKDLMESDDLSVNKEKLNELAISKGLQNARIFATSAKLEQQGNSEESGYPELRQYIQKNITGGRAPLLKLESSLNTVQNFTARIQAGLEIRTKQWEADVAFRKDIQNSLDDQKGRSEKQVDMLIDNLVMGFDKIGAEKREELAHGLSFFSLLKRSIQSIFSKKGSLKGWLTGLAENIEKDMKLQMSDRLENGVEELAEQIRTMVKIIDLKIRNSQTILKNDHEFFSEIADNRSRVLSELQSTFSSFLADQNNFKDAGLFPRVKDLSPRVAAGSGLAIIGILLTTVTQGMVFDITGGVITALGLTLAGVSASLNKGKILKTYDQEMKMGRDRMENELKPMLYTYIERLKDKIDKQFLGFDEHLTREEKEITRLGEDLDDVIHLSEDEEKRIQDLLKTN